VFQQVLSYFGRTFLRINYIDISKNTYRYNRSRKITEMVDRKVLNNNCYTFIDYQVRIKTRRNS